LPLFCGGRIPAWKIPEEKLVVREKKASILGKTWRKHGKIFRSGANTNRYSAGLVKSKGIGPG
jgi:hypothetical protein